MEKSNSGSNKASIFLKAPNLFFVFPSTKDPFIKFKKAFVKSTKNWNQ